MRKQKARHFLDRRIDLFKERQTDQQSFEKLINFTPKNIGQHKTNKNNSGNGNDDPQAIKIKPETIIKERMEKLGQKALNAIDQEKEQVDRERDRRKYDQP